MKKILFKSKTGEKVQDTMGGLILLLVVVAVVAGVFFTPGIGIFSRGTKAVHANINENMPVGGTPDVGGSGATSEASGLKSELSVLASSVNNVGANDKCLVYISELAGITDKHFIRLEENRAKLMEKSDKPGAEPLPIKTEVLTNFLPCQIKGEDALKFFNCYLKPGPKTCNEPPISPIKKEGLQLDLTKDNKYKFLFKSGYFFCTFEFYDSGSCGYNNGAIAKGCQEIMPYFENNLTRCDYLDGTKNLDNKEKAELDAKKIADSIKKGLASPSNKCLVKYDTLSLSSWKIGMIQDSSKLKFVQVDNGGNIGKLDVPDIDGQLCIINSNNGVNLGDPASLKRAGIKELGGKYHLTVGGKYDNEANAYFNLKDDAKFRALYKKDASHVCFLALREDNLGGCDDHTDAGIDDDCYKKWIDEEKIFECSFLNNLNGVFLCDNEECKYDPPHTPWRKTIINVNSVCDVKPSAEDSEPDGNKICTGTESEIGSIRIIGNYDIRLYENINYNLGTLEKRRTICFSNEGYYRLDDYPIKPHDGWNLNTHSVEILADGTCANSGITTVTDTLTSNKLYLYDGDAKLLKFAGKEGHSSDLPTGINKDIHYFSLIKDGDAVRFYEDDTYEGKHICFKDSGNLFIADISGDNTWEDDADSFKIISDDDCTNPGVTEG